jgi:L-seryl-tRNA(Ser) seleniumtransferase
LLLDEIGVKKVINAWGTVTVLGGTTMSDEVLDAMKEASKAYVDMKELHKKAGEYIARLLNVEAACITSGATAGLVLALATCITGGDRERILKLPGTEGKNRVIVQQVENNAFINILQTAGAEIFRIGSEKETTAQDLERALDETVAAVMYFVFDPRPGVLPLDQVLKISRAKGIPVIVDAAAELPPMENLRKFVGMGADVVVFSGGKALGGPSDTGLVLGRKDLVETIVRLEYYENVGNQTVALLGRSMKVSKEDILALVKALQQYVEKDHNQEMKDWETKVDYMVSALSKSKLPPARKVIPGSGHGPRPLVIPTVAIDFKGWMGSAEEMKEKLRSGDPSIYVYLKDNVLFLNPQCLQDDEEKTIVKRLLALS